MEEELLRIIKTKRPKHQVLSTWAIQGLSHCAILMIVNATVKISNLHLPTQWCVWWVVLVSHPWSCYGPQYLHPISPLVLTKHCPDSVPVNEKERTCKHSLHLLPSFEVIVINIALLTTEFIFIYFILVFFIPWLESDLHISWTGGGGHNIEQGVGHNYDPLNLIHSIHNLLHLSTNIPKNKNWPHTWLSKWWPQPEYTWLKRIVRFELWKVISIYQRCSGNRLLQYTFSASSPVTTTIRRMPLAMASSEAITKLPMWPLFCKCLK